MLNLTKYPSHCHVFKSGSSSSKRTQVAALAYKMSSATPVKHQTFHNQQLSQIKKRNKLWNKMKHLKSNSKSQDCSLTEVYINKHIVVYDGGDKVTPPLVSPVNINWKSYRISSGDLWIQDTTNPNLGLQYGCLNDTPIFFRLPHSHSLEILKDSCDLCNAICCCVKAQKKSVKRGSKCEVFAQPVMNTCVLELRHVQQRKASIVGTIVSRKDSQMNTGISFSRR